MIKYFFFLGVVFGLFNLCTSQAVYRFFLHNDKALTVKVAESGYIHSLVWEPRRAGDLTQRFRVSNGYIISAYFEPEEYVLDVKAGTIGFANVIVYPRHAYVANNQQWKITTTVESKLASGLFIQVYPNGGVDNAVVDFAPAIPITSDDVTVDWVFCMDTTGSMGGDINAVKADAVDITNKLYDAGVDARIAVFDYRDYPSRTAVQDYPYDLKMQFSRSQPDVINGLNALKLGWGGDFPESAYACIMAALKGKAGYWRASAEKYILVMTDADPLNPEPISGYTAASVIAATSDFTLMNVTTDRLYTRSVTEDPALPPARIYAAVVRNAFVVNNWKGLCQATGGDALFATSSSGVVDLIMTVLDNITEPIIASRLPKLSLTAEATNNPASQKLSVNFVITNTGASDATSVLVNITWPCINNVAVSFPSGPFAFSAEEPNTLLVVVDRTIYAGGGSYAFAVSSDAVCANSTVTEVGAAATDVPTGATSGPASLSFNTTTPTPTVVDCGSMHTCGGACYDPTVYDCAESALYPKGYRKCGTGLYDTSAHDCINEVLCPKNHLLCGERACYYPSSHVCINSVKLCPTTHSSLCGEACFDTSVQECCNNDGPEPNLCEVGAACGC